MIKYIRYLILSVLLLFLIPTSANAKPVTDVTGSYGLVKCNHDDVNGLSSCSYVNSYSIIGNDTTYTMLDKASMFSVAGTTHLRYNVFTSLYLFPNLNYKNGSFYTLNFEFNQGSYVSTIINTLSKDNLIVESFTGSDYQTGGYTDLNYSSSYNDTTKSGTISITFKATTDTSSYRIRVQPGVPVWTNTSVQYAQGVRVYLISANVEDNLSDALLNQITNQNEIIINQNQQIIDNSKNTTEEQKKTNNILTDDTIDDNINFNYDDLTDESGIQDLLLMPLTLMNAVNTGFNSPCSSFSLGSLYGHDLSLQCFTISDILGSNLSNIIDVIISGMFIYLFSKHLRKVFDRTTNLENEEGDVI